MQIHRAPGPPRTTVVLVDGVARAVLEVAPGHQRGAIHRAQGSGWWIDRTPGSDEWWVSSSEHGLVATIARTALVRERFTLDLGGEYLHIEPHGSPWRRRWRVVDDRDRGLLEVVQRPLSRTIHDLRTTSGDVPPALPLLVAWTLTLATSAPMPATRRPRWAVR